MQKNTVRTATGAILTGQLWRKDQEFVQQLPFYSNLPRMEEMAGPLEGAFGDPEGITKALLIVRSFPFSCQLGSIYFAFHRNVRRVWTRFTHSVIPFRSILF